MGFSQARILEWVAISYSRWSSQPRYQTHVSYISYTCRRIIYHCTTWEAYIYNYFNIKLLILCTYINTELYIFVYIYNFPYQYWVMRVFCSLTVQCEWSWGWLNHKLLLLDVATSLRAPKSGLRVLRKRENMEQTHSLLYHFDPEVIIIRTHILMWEIVAKECEKCILSQVVHDESILWKNYMKFCGEFAIFFQRTFTKFHYVYTTMESTMKL